MIFMIWSIIVFFIRCTVGGVFVTAALLKLFSGAASFAHQIAAYQIIPARYSSLFAYLLLPLELFAGISLIAGLFFPFTLLLAAALLVMFLLATAHQLWRGRESGCGCFGGRGKTASQWTVVWRNLVLLGLLAILSWAGWAVGLWGLFLLITLLFRFQLTTKRTKTKPIQESSL